MVYRDASAQLLVTLPARPGDPPLPPDCTTPLLIDPATGSAKAIAPAAMAERLKVMQLAAATPGTCDIAPQAFRRR